MAEKLCYMNDWDHFAVPISALEAALKHGQLDTVAFYLKTKGKGTRVCLMWVLQFVISKWKVDPEEGASLLQRKHLLLEAL